MRARSRRGAILVAAATTASLAVAVSVSADAPLQRPPLVRAPLVCSRGPDRQFFTAAVTVPREVPAGSTYAVRIDSVPSAEIAHTGLNYLHDMATDYVLPPGVAYVPGSARFVPRTGSANVMPGARVWNDGGMIRVLLPAHVENGSRFTPPSIELELRVTAPAGARLAIELAHFRLAANVFLLGDLHTDCDPVPKPYVLGTTLVTP